MKRGFTFTEIIIVIAIAGIALSVIMAGIGFGDNKNEAEKSARAYAEKLEMDLQAVNCVSRDTNNDGYVSCTLMVRQPNGRTGPMAVVCAKKFSINDGCKIPETKVRTSLW